MKRFFVILSAGMASLAVLAFSAGGALAGLSWCWGDPQIGITAGNTNLDINVLVGVPEEERTDLDSDVLIVVGVPSNVDAQVLRFDGVLPERVVVVKRADVWGPSQSSIKVDVSVLVNDSESFPVALLIEYREANGKNEQILKTGLSNETISRQFGLEIPR